MEVLEEELNQCILDETLHPECELCTKYRECVRGKESLPRIRSRRDIE